MSEETEVESPVRARARRRDEPRPGRIRIHEPAPWETATLAVNTDDAFIGLAENRFRKPRSYFTHDESHPLDGRWDHFAWNIQELGRFENEFGIEAFTKAEDVELRAYFTDPRQQGWGPEYWRERHKQLILNNFTAFEDLAEFRGPCLLAAFERHMLMGRSVDELSTTEMAERMPFLPMPGDIDRRSQRPGLSFRYEEPPELEGHPFKKFDKKWLAQYEKNNLETLLGTYNEWQWAGDARMVNYIHTLAENSRTEIENWDIIEIFGDRETMRIIKDKKEINKRFFAPRIPSEMIGGEKVVEINELKPFDVAAVFDGDVANIARALEPQLKQLETSYKTKLAESNIARDNYLKIFVAHRELSRKNPNDENFIIKQLREIEKTGLFTIEKYSASENTFIMKNVKPFIVKLLPTFQENGITEVPLGYFDIKVNFLTFNVFMTPRADNNKFAMQYYSTPAPFLGGAGKVCFGNEQIRVDKFLKVKDLVGLMRLVWDIMNTYEEGVGPHRNILDYVNELAMRLPYKELIAAWEENGKFTKAQKKQLGSLNYAIRNYPGSRAVWDFKNKEWKDIRRTNDVETPCCNGPVVGCKCRES